MRGPLSLQLLSFCFVLSRRNSSEVPKLEAPTVQIQSPPYA